MPRTLRSVRRRTTTLTLSVVLAVVLGVVSGLTTVPFVALGPGPTFNTLGQVDGEPVVAIEGERTYPTTGHLNLTTVSVVDGITLFTALAFWLSGRRALVPRDEVFPPNLSEAEVERRNTELFQNSESAAESAALRYLGYPSEPVVEGLEDGAAAAGRLEPGDEIVAVEGVPVSSAEQVVAELADSAPGDTVEIGYRRGDGPPQTVPVVLAAGEEPGQGYLGIRVSDLAAVDFDITISLTDVGGPSAGLMFALSIVDKLTPGPLADGTFVAGTGEITSGGDVGPIGGIPFKMLKADEAGATVFLVPAGNCAEALSRAPEGLRLIRVATLDEAVDALEAMGDGRPTPRC